MSKSFLFKFILALSFVIAAVLYLLNVLDVITFFNLAWAVTLVAGTAGILFVLKGLFEKNVGMLKKLNILLGAGLLIVTVFSLVSAIALADKIVFPIIAIIVTVAILLCAVAVGGKKWDEGDNKQVGYKNYHQRKAEQDKQDNQKED